MFFKYAESNTKIWDRIIGNRIVHKFFGDGVITAVSAKNEVYIEVEFSHEGNKKFTKHAFLHGFITDLDLPEWLDKEIHIYEQKRQLKLLEENRNKERACLELIQKHNIKSLWYIVHVKHLYSILKTGIHCRNHCVYNRLIKTDISDLEVQSRRVTVHSFVNLYFADNTPMLYKVIKKWGLSIVLIEIDPVNVLRGKVKIADGNAACDQTMVYDEINFLDRLDWKIIFSRYPACNGEAKRKRMAEVLVDNHVKPANFRCIHVQSFQTQLYVEDMLKRTGMGRIPIKCDLTSEGVG